MRSVLAGTPQGGVISPLLSNIYLHVLDKVWTRQARAPRRAGALRGRLRRDVRDGGGVRGGGATGRRDPRAARSWSCTRRRRGESTCRAGQAGLRLPRLSPAEAHVGADLGEGAQTRLLPPAVAVGAQHEAGAAAREGADRPRAGIGVKDVRVLIRDLNPVLRGWGNYFRTGNAADEVQPGRHATSWRRLARLRDASARGGTSAPARPTTGRATSSTATGSTACAAPSATRRPRNARLERPPVSRVREIRTHGLKGGLAPTPPLGREGR